MQASNTDASSGRQQFLFDDEGRLLEHRTFLGDRELSRDRYTWASGKLTIEGGLGHVEITLGPHGEARIIQEGKARSTLVWEGTFAEAPGAPNLEGIYAISAGGGSRHLPLDTTARGMHQRMGTFRFTGKVSVRDALGPTVQATYDGGRIVGWETEKVRGRVRWTPDGAPEREVSEEPNGGPASSELVYDRRDGRTVATHYRGGLGGATRRDVVFTWAQDGQLARVESTISDGRESSSQTVLLGACTHGPTP